MYLVLVDRFSVNQCKSLTVHTCLCVRFVIFVNVIIRQALYISCYSCVASQNFFNLHYFTYLLK